jgi:acylphosphatase
VVGWVRNLPDGRVEAYFEGEEEAVRSLVEWCRSGPPGAVVEAVEVDWGEPKGEHATFTIKPTPL